jgi:hypothetical protein
VAEAGAQRPQGGNRAADPRPIIVKDRDQLTGEESDERRVFFKTAFVFDISQTDILPGVEPVALEPPHQPLTGDSHAHLLTPQCRFAESSDSRCPSRRSRSMGWWCGPKAKRIVVDAGVPANAQLRTLILGLGHAPGDKCRRNVRMCVAG